ncbi:MAG: M23 family metallopeptidase [Gammaproteobacteria bacterium]
MSKTTTTITNFTHIIYERQQLFYRILLVTCGAVINLILLFNILKPADQYVIAAPKSVFRALGNTIYDKVSLELSIQGFNNASEALLPKEEIGQSKDFVMPESLDYSFEKAVSENTDVSTPILETASSTQSKSQITAPKITSTVIKQHDTLTKIAIRIHANKSDVAKILSLPQAFPILSNLQNGKTIDIKLNQKGDIQKVVYKINKEKQLTITRLDTGFRSEVLINGLQQRILSTSVLVQNSLSKSGLRPKLVMQLPKVFGSADVVNKVKSGQRISVLYEQTFKNGKAFQTGNILAAQINDHGKKTQVIRFVDRNGRVGYYTPEGKSLESGFLRAPLHYSHIASRFSLHRYHPILHIVRAHKGVDLAAPSGTPVYAASDGVIRYAGRKGGYGNVIEIRSARIYTGIYAHLKRFARGLHSGQVVHRGQVIGYVGMTGLAEGPHLHYELHINGVPHDPLSVKLPSGGLLPHAQRTAFINYADHLVKKLA